MPTGSSKKWNMNKIGNGTRGRNLNKIGKGCSSKNLQGKTSTVLVMTVEVLAAEMEVMIDDDDDDVHREIRICTKPEHQVSPRSVETASCAVMTTLIGFSKYVRYSRNSFTPATRLLRLIGGLNPNLPSPNLLLPTLWTTTPQAAHPPSKSSGNAEVN